MTLQVGDYVGPYRVLPLEGSGGMAEVYRARDSRLNRDVALKVLHEHRAFDAHALARLTREAQALAALNHPNIASIFGVEECGGVQALVLELVEGPTLSDRIAQGPMSLAETMAIGRQIAAALEAAHEHGIVHRDLKPSNIKLRPDGTVKVLDFGLAKIVDASVTGVDEHAATITAPVDMVMGTAAYMSPEQAKGGPVDKRTDIWAFGCIVYEMLTGRAPFTGRNAVGTIAAVLSEEPAWDRLPGSLSPTCLAFLQRCLRKDPAERIRDIGDVRLALDGGFDPAPALVASARASTSGRERLRQMLLWVTGAVVVIGVTGVGLRIVTLERDADPMTFVVHAPEGSAFSRVTMHPYPAISPDGRRMVFVAEWESRLALWVQSIGDLEASLLPGTEGATSPFWSPDGRFIAFVAGGQLKKVSLAGGRPVQTVFAGPTTSGGVWTPDGTIVFAGAGGLYRVVAEGGPPEPLTRLDESRGEFSHRWPAPLPGSATQFIYLIRSTRDDARGLYLGSLADANLKQRLVAEDSNGAFGSDAAGRLHLFFVRDSTLLAQPFDAGRGRLAGEPVVIAHPIVAGQTGRLAPFAVAGRTLVYRPTVPNQTRMVWMDRRGDRGSTVGETSTEYRYPSLSPDGSSLAVARFDAGTGRFDTWVFDLLRQTSERLTQDPVSASFPVWMPDGRRVVFSSARAGPWDLYWRSSTGSGNPETLYRAPTPGEKYPTGITSDGRFLLFQGAGQVWRLPLAGQEKAAPLLPGMQGRVSPDGRWLAYTTTETVGRQVYVTTFPEPTERWRISTASGQDPQWRSDGRELYYIEDAQTLMAVPIRPGDAFEAGPPRSLFRASFAPMAMTFGPAYAPAPDGQRFLVLEGARGGDVLLQVTLNWTPDGMARRP